MKARWYHAPPSTLCSLGEDNHTYRQAIFVRWTDGGAETAPPVDTRGAEQPASERKPAVISPETGMIDGLQNAEIVYMA